jgi:hypothetical protein
MVAKARQIGQRGIFCLEGQWDKDLRLRRSVLPILVMLESHGSASHIHRDVGTRGELALYLEKFGQKRYDHFEVLFLAFHGSRGNIYVEDNAVSIEDLADMIGDSARGKIIYFGSCATLNASPERLKQFQERTGARFVAGYTRNVDMITTCAFEVALLDALAFYSRPGDAFNYLRTKALSSTAKALGFKAVAARSSAGLGL